jgi:hypothetical protein
MKTAFIITSALNTRFGVYTPEQRLEQTLATIASVKNCVPDAKLIAVELAGVSPTDEQRRIMEDNLDVYVDLSTDENVRAIYNSTDNWDIVKSSTEVMGFGNALQQLSDAGELEGIDRVFKLSGRYLLSDTFDIDIFASRPDRIVVANRKQSQFGPAITGGITEQYMSRLWSWPADQTQTVIDTYQEGLIYIAETFARGGYCDIEHMLFKYLPADLVDEVERVGVCGNIAPTGQAIID